MLFTGRTMMLSQCSMDESIKRLKACGFEGLEMCFGQRDFRFRPDMTEGFFAEHTVKTAEKLNMPICSTSYHAGYVYDNERFELVKQAIWATPMYGTRVCIISNTMRTDDDKKDWKTLVDRTKYLVEQAERADVTLAMEFEPGMICGTTQALHRLFEEVGSCRLMANADIGHMFLCDPDPIASIRSLKGKIAHCHVENMRRGVHQHLTPQIGEMDLKVYFDALKEAGFDGAAALDLYNGDYEQLAPEAVSYLKTLDGRY